MSGCHPPYSVGNVAFNNYCNPQIPSQGFMCACPCHQAVWMSTQPPKCWCSCHRNSTTIKVVSDNSKIEIAKLQQEIAVLRETVKKKPHICPVCKGQTKVLYFSETAENNNLYLPCKTCDAKGIVWG